jgi:hypothetical protein
LSDFPVAREAPPPTLRRPGLPIAGRLSTPRRWTGNGRKKSFRIGKKRRSSRASTACTGSRWPDAWHRRKALEMHPNFVVYNPRTLLRLREAVGEEIGANNDLSHLFWQGCDPVEVIHLLGKQSAIFHAHMKDTVLYQDNVAKYGVLNFAFDTPDLVNASETFRAVGYGHSANLWKSILQAYMDIGYEGILSIENEDPILSGEVGVERAAYVLKNVRKEILEG